MAGLKTKIEYLCVFFFGGIVYSLIEILWRGFTHWTMTVAGGLCFLLLYLLNRRMMHRLLLLRCLVGTVLITAVELSTGVIVNLLLHLDVWDYSEMRFQLLGQICLPFSCMWFLLCIPAFLLGTGIRCFFTAIEIEDNG